MLIIFIIIFLCIISSLSFSKGTIRSDYASKAVTQPIKGLFTAYVFLSHARQYAVFVHPADLLVIHYLDYLGQLMVAPFLFYSGYGIFESIKKKGSHYVRSIPANRIGKTFFDFAFAIVLFLITGQFIEKSYSWKQILLSLTGWTSVGNSNWYMFAIFALYIMTYMSFRFLDNKNFTALCVMTILSLIYVYVMSGLQPDRFSNTALCYVAGMWYSYFKEKTDILLTSHNTIYYIMTVLLLVTYMYCYPLRSIRILYFNAVSVLYCLCIIFISMKITTDSKVLNWFGEHLFWIYILQRIPMNLLEYHGIAAQSPYIFLGVSLVLTLLMAQYIPLFTKKAKSFIWH